MLFLQIFYAFLALVVTFVAALPLVEEGSLVNLTAPCNLSMSDPAIASEQGHDPSFFWDSRSVVQVWMGKDKTQVGSKVGSLLYDHMWKLLDENCPVEILRRVCHKSPNAEIDSACMDTAGKHHGCKLIISRIDAEWTTDAIRKYLITAVASALEAATSQDASDKGNCWNSGGIQKLCNVGDVVRVNFPELPEGRPNYIHIRLKNWYSGYGNYNCCGEGIRSSIDDAMDKQKDGIKLEFPKQADNARFRDSRCIINGDAICP